MALTPILSALLVALIADVECESSNGYKFNSGSGSAPFGELLKPPPLPLSHIQPVPFHGGTSRSQRQNVDTGYHYQPPPPPPPPPSLSSSEFKFPAPFYKQYNFNFVPPPQPFTTPASSMFQKVSSWLFPSQDTGSDSGSAFNNNNIAPIKKDCNPCNLVPWIPVIRYDLGAKNMKQSLIPTYGPPSPTAQNVVQFRPRPFYSQNQELPQVSGGVPHASYGPPVSSNAGLSSTYGPPSPTHTVALPTSSTFIPSPSFPIQSSSFGSSTSSLGQLSSSYNSVSSSYGVPSSTYKQLGSSYGVPSSTYGAPSSTYELPSSIYGLPSASYGVSSSTLDTPSSTYTTTAPSFFTPRPLTSTYLPVTPSYTPELLNNELPQENQAETIKNSQPADGLELPKISPPYGFRNSYGEPISNNYAGSAPYPVSATAAESTKIRTEVLPSDVTKKLQANGTIALANPAPFTLNRGRNIHTLQPVALPNLSVNPLPPIFNARPFRPLSTLKFPPNHALGINHMQQTSNNVNIEQSVPIAEYTHSVDYPTSFIQSPIIDIDVSTVSNQSKAYRNIPNGFILDSIRDISSQASEDHLSATKSNQDSSFESTGADVGNDLYEPGIPTDLKYNSGSTPSNHKNNFVDLRGIKDEDVDKYRTESNLQNIDSPLLYLKPGAPHKEYTNFIISTTVRTNLNDYEIYDDIPTTTEEPKQSIFTSAWDESRTDYSDAFAEPTAAQEDANKPKIVQIIIPYTTKQQNEQTDQFNQNPEEWISTPEDDFQARKIPTVTESYINYDSGTESYTTVSSTTEGTNKESENHESVTLNTPAILNDLYDVKEPPFDIIKLQHNIDDWTEQEFSKRFKTQSQRTRTNGKYAKQIPDEYFTTNSPVTQYLTPSTVNYEFYDHEGSSSIRHSVTDDDSSNSFREYNSIDRNKKKKKDHENDDPEELQKLHIYTAASSFRGTTTTPAPWGKIETSISPLTKEKVYVVTSQPWMTTENATNSWLHVPFESKKTGTDNDVSASDSLPFHSPRFSNRPSLTIGNKKESVNSESSYGFSRNWHQRINDLENLKKNNSTSLPEGSQHKSTNKEEGTHHTTVTAELLEDVIVRTSAEKRN